MSKIKTRKLSELNSNVLAKVISIKHDDYFTSKLEALGLTLNKTLKVSHKHNMHGPIIIEINSTSFMLRSADAEKIKVALL